MEDRKRRSVRRIRQVRIKGRQIFRAYERFISDGARAERNDMEAVQPSLARTSFELDPHRVQLALETIFIEPARFRHERLKHVRSRALCNAPEGLHIHRHFPDGQTLEVRTRESLGHDEERRSPGLRLPRDKEHRDRKVGLRARRQEQLTGNRRKDTRAIPRPTIGMHGSTMFEPLQSGERERKRPVSAVARALRYETNAAGVAFTVQLVCQIFHFGAKL